MFLQLVGSTGNVAALNDKTSFFRLMISGRIVVVAVGEDRSRSRRRTGKVPLEGSMKSGTFGQCVVGQVVDHVTAGSRLTRGAGGTGLVGAVAVFDVVVDAGRLGLPPVIRAVPPGSESDGFDVAASVYSRTGTGELGQSRSPMLGHVPVEVALMHAVDGDQKNVLGLVAAAGGSGVSRQDRTVANAAADTAASATRAGRVTFNMMRS